jgi:hypothetical protein
MHEQEREREAVRTTIVGGRPPGSGRSNITVPRGIEVLVKKAAVDPAFRELLLEQRGAAAAAIELALDPAERAMLNAIPRAQLVQIVGQTVVPLEQRRVFLGRIAAAMLAVLGAGLAGCKPAKSRGIQSDLPERLAKNDSPSPVFQSAGVQPDRPETPQTNSPPALPPETKPPATNKPAPPTSRGIQPDRP